MDKKKIITVFDVMKKNDPDKYAEVMKVQKEEATKEATNAEEKERLTGAVLELKEEIENKDKYEEDLKNTIKEKDKEIKAWKKRIKELEKAIDEMSKEVPGLAPKEEEKKEEIKNGE